MRRFVLALALLLSVPAGAVDTTSAAGSLPPPPRQKAGDVPLSEPIAPVPSGLANWTFALSSLVGVADPFYDKVILLGTVRHGRGHWAIEAFGGRAFSWAGPALDICTSPSACTSPSGQKLGATPGELTYIGGLAGVWRAAEGKLSVGGLEPFKFSLEANFGPAAVLYQVNLGHPETLWSPAARLGLGLAASLRNDLAVRLDLQGLFYRSEIRGSPEFDREMLIGASIAWQPGGSP